jgi:hypothetical protein
MPLGRKAIALSLAVSALSRQRVAGMEWIGSSFSCPGATKSFEN